MPPAHRRSALGSRVVHAGQHSFELSAPRQILRLSWRPRTRGTEHNENGGGQQS